MCNPQPVTFAPVVTRYDAQPSQSDGTVTQTVYCPAFWQLYDDLDAQAAAGTLDDYGVSYRLRDHLLACGECKSVQVNRQGLSIIVNGLKESAPNLQGGD